MNYGFPIIPDSEFLIHKWSHPDRGDIPRESGGMSILNNLIKAVYAEFQT